MIPMCLITGFLGSGKTTFLKRVVEQYKDKKFVYLVNEFSPRDVDGALLAAEGVDVVAVPGGSIFCKCLVTGFIHHLSTIPEKFNTPDAPVEGVVIEAGGVADPRVVRRMLAETRLDKIYRLTRIIGIVEPKSLLKLLQTLPNIKAQIESADHLVVNKTDLCSPDETARAVAEIRKLNPHARTEETSWCRTETDVFAPAPARDLQGEYARCADPHYARLSVRFSGPVNSTVLKRALASLGSVVYRAKGFIGSEAGPAYFDASPAGISMSPAAATAARGEPELVLIVGGGAVEKVKERLDAMENLIVSVSA